jgi:hypothetical protein
MELRGFEPLTLSMRTRSLTWPNMANYDIMPAQRLESNAASARSSVLKVPADR